MTPQPRHASVEHVARLLDPNPNLTGTLAVVAGLTADFRDELLALLPNDGPELTAGLRKLLEAKDCLVRQALLDQRAEAGELSN
ncbi:hypothetical protein SEA_ZENTENO07_81 [Mycobacterium phage Zenteno07]|nr:hypothetical protein SEA_ZENTENO07_81 [Mycobacterium phage Zenteno07]